MAEIKKELYGIPEHLDVDKSKSNANTNFADRTAMHIKSGLSEVIIEKVERKSSTGDERSKDLTKSPTRRHHSKHDKNLS